MARTTRILFGMMVGLVIGVAGLHFVPVPAGMSEFSHFVIAEQLRRSSQICEKVTGVYIRNFWSESQIFEIYCQDGYRYAKGIDNKDPQPRVYASK